MSKLGDLGRRAREQWPEYRPVPKVELPILAGAITTFGSWVWEQFGQEPLPNPVSVALTVMIMAVAGWLAPRR